MPDYYMSAPEKKSISGRKLIGLIVILVLLVVATLNFLFPTVHKCTWLECELRGETEFRSTWDYLPGTCGYKTEYTHWKNPEWTYEQCEKYVIGGVE